MGFGDRRGKHKNYIHIYGTYTSKSINFHRYSSFIMYIKSFFARLCNRFESVDSIRFIIITFNALNAKWRHLCFVVVVLVKFSYITFCIFLTFRILQRNYFRPPFCRKLGLKLCCVVHFHLMFRSK